MKKIYILFISLVLLLTSCNSQETQKEIQKYYKTTEVSSWVLTDDDYFVTYTDSFDKVWLAPKVWGRIVSINKKVWDKVAVWELVASLDWTEAKTGYSSASQVISSLQNLKNSTSISYDKQIEATKEKLNQMEAWKDISDISISWADKWLSDTKNITDSQIKTVETQISQAKLWLETAKLQLENWKANLEQKEKDVYTNSKNAITASFVLWNNVLSFLDETFWVSEENKDKDDAFEDYIWAKDSSKKSELKAKIQKAIDDLKTLEEEFKNISNDNDKERILTELKKVYNFFNSDIKTILSISYSVVDSSISSIWSLSQIQINTFKETITTFQTNNEQVILSVEWNYTLGLKWSIDNIENFEKTKKSNLDMLKKSVENAEKQIEVLEQTLKMYQGQSSGQITKVETWLAQAKKQKEIVLFQIAEAKAWIEAIKKQKQASLSEIDAKIAEAKGSMNDASVMIQNWKIYSNISGVVVKKMFDEWSVISAWMPILMVSNSYSIKLEVLVSEDLSSILKIWDIADVKIDWLDELQKAKITNIFPSKDALTKRVWIELKIENSNWKIKLWSYSKVYFSSKNSEKWIIIPNKAILEKYMIPWVYVLKWEKAIFKKIKILKQNDDFSEIEWLQIWEKIITDWKENIFDSEKIK